MAVCKNFLALLVSLVVLGSAHGFFSISIKHEPNQRWRKYYDFSQESDAAYCRRSTDHCIDQFCNLLRNNRPRPNCEDNYSLRSEIRNRMINCYGELNECLTRKPMMTCSYYGNDNQCPRYTSCINGQCYWNSIKKYCSNNYDCNNNLYECRDHECHLRPYNYNNNWSNWSPDYQRWGSLTVGQSSWNDVGHQSSADHSDGYTGMACSLNSHCPQFQTCAFNQCWSSQLMRECHSDSDCPHRHVYYCSWKRCKAR